VKLFILALDGLDYNLVEKWRLRGIMQRKYGKLRVPVTEEGFALSPQVWASFLTGRTEEKKFVKPKLLVLVETLRKYIPLSLGIGKKISKILGTPPIYPELNRDTFLTELPENSYYVFNFPYINFQGLEILRGFIKGEYSLKDTRHILRKLYQLRMRQVLNLTRREEQLILAYMEFPDLTQHFFPNRAILHHYLTLDTFIKRLSKRLVDRVLILVSDHGFDPKTRMHTDYGFYSANMDIKLTDIREFHDLILNIFK